MGVLQDPPLEDLLERLHTRSRAQDAAMKVDAVERAKALPPTGPQREAALKAYLGDKLVALDRDKAELCYQLCRAAGARRIVEIGTSYGISTLYLAAAVRDHVRAAGGDGIVIGTEYEPRKADAARAHFDEAGLNDLIDLREGDLRETLRNLTGPIDFVLMDIWTPMARPALDLVAPHLRPGAIVICDNTVQARAGYVDYFAAINNPARGFRTLTLPFDGGLELSVYYGDQGGGGAQP